MELIEPGRFYPTNRHAAQAFRGEQAAEKEAGREEYSVNSDRS